MAFEETPIIGQSTRPNKVARIAGPLIKIPKGKWVRDPGISELLDYFDRPELLDIKNKGERWSKLRVGEISEITKVIDRCRNDFQYAARNFFWISTKDRGEKLFSLWEAQELILEYMMQLKARGIAQRVQIIKARQLGALDPETKVLTATLEWKRIDDLQVGEAVISVDEFSYNRTERKLRTAQILNKWDVIKEAYRITFANGKSIIATGDHPFLCRKRGQVSTEWRKVDQKVFDKRTSSPIRQGDEVRFSFDDWYNVEPTFEDGWMAGLLDGEGSLRAKPNGGIEISVAQVEGAVLTRALKYFKDRSYDFHCGADRRTAGESSKLGDKPVYKITINQSQQVLKLLGITKPSRFSGREVWSGKTLPNLGEGKSWVKVISVEKLGQRRMVDIETTTKTFIAEGFVTHNCSTLIEALIAWRSMFFANVTAFVIADEPARAAKLFGIMQYIYDRCPWWMQPMCSSREFRDGLIFENKNPDERRTNPGLNSQIIVNAANKLTGVAQGYSVNACHASEYPSWEQKRAREIIEEDLGNALAPGPETFAFLEGTAKGAGTFAHKLWIKNFNSGDNAKWFPKFLPWFFEVNRTRPIPQEWQPEPPEVDMRERVERDWVRCQNDECKQYHERFLRGEDRDGGVCPTCEVGALKSYILTDEQCAWMGYERKDAEGDPESLNNLRQEQCVTAEESFILNGVKVFSDASQAWANQCVEQPLAVGMLDAKGKFHGCDPRKKITTSVPGEFWNPCFQKDCSANHKFDPIPLQIWRWPQMGRRYVIGGDVAEGLGGDSNSSVGFVLMEGAMNEPDEQVATYRSNEIDRIGFAQALVWLGLFYNKALLAIESNRYDTVAWTVQEKFMYPNCYRSRLQGTNNVSVKLGWETTEKSKSRIYDTFRRWMEYKELKLRSRNLAEEMKTFKREDNEKGNGRGTYGAAKGFQDDELMACMIALFVAHAGDYDENLGYVVMRADLSMDNAIWHMACGSCFERWPANSLQDANNCPRCKSMHVSGVKNPTYTPKELVDPEEEAKAISFYNDSWSRLEAGITEPAGQFAVPDYDDL